MDKMYDKFMEIDKSPYFHSLAEIYVMLAKEIVQVKRY